MSKNFAFYESKDLDKELELPLQFDAVVAGETEEKQIFVENISRGRIEISQVTTRDSDEVKVESFASDLTQGSAGEIVLSFQPNTTDHKPVEADLVFDYKLTISQ